MDLGRTIGVRLPVHIERLLDDEAERECSNAATLVRRAVVRDFASRYGDSISTTDGSVEGKGRVKNGQMAETTPERPSGQPAPASVENAGVSA